MGNSVRRVFTSVSVVPRSLRWRRLPHAVVVAGQFSYLVSNPIRKLEVRKPELHWITAYALAWTVVLLYMIHEKLHGSFRLPSAAVHKQETFVEHGRGSDVYRLLPYIDAILKSVQYSERLSLFTDRTGYTSATLDTLTVTHTCCTEYHIPSQQNRVYTQSCQILRNSGRSDYL